jgi:hypothetical protein
VTLGNRPSATAGTKMRLSVRRRCPLLTPIGPSIVHACRDRQQKRVSCRPVGRSDGLVLVLIVVLTCASARSA